MAHLFTPGPATDPWYVACREHRSKRGVRLRLECMWRAYEPFCPDPHFLVDARSHFVARSWELYLAAALLRNGLQLNKPPPHGPDLLITMANGRVWIEAVAALEGDGADRVPSRNERGTRTGSVWHGNVPSEETIALRCATALAAKRAKLDAYRKAGIVADEDIYVVALTLGGIVDADVASPDLPMGVKVLFGIGEAVLRVPIDEGEPEFGFAQRQLVRKRRGADVGTTLFSDPASAGISAVVYTDCDIFNAPRAAGRDLVVIHNPLARAALPRGTLHFAGQEFWVSDGFLQRSPVSA